jgi:nitrile hydratase accessory protein
VHNVIVCTLCSCYTWPVLGLPPNWYKAPPYRSRMVRTPRQVLRDDFGLDLPESVEIRVWDSSAELRYFVLPQRPPDTESLSAEQLAELATRDSMIGVGQPLHPEAALMIETEDRDAARRRVEHLLLELPHQEAIRPENGEVAFETAREIRAFALALAAHESGQYEWSKFQQGLIAAIRSWEESGTGEPWRYYDRWLEALETLLADTGVLDPTELDARTRTVLTTPRDMHHQGAKREPVAVDAAAAG